MTWFLLLFLFERIGSTTSLPLLAPGQTSCDCLDWYGDCHTKLERWVDDDTWMYECQGDYQEDATIIGCRLLEQNTNLTIGENRTIDELWFSCKADDESISLEREPFCLVDGIIRKVHEQYRVGRFRWKCLETGQWVTGCYYANETEHDIVLNIGEARDEGLVKHVCERYEDNPGLIQYYTQINDEVLVQTSGNLTWNHNLPTPADNRIGEITKWTHDKVDVFLAGDDMLRKKIRYLPKSREPWKEIKS